MRKRFIQSIAILLSAAVLFVVVGCTTSQPAPTTPPTTPPVVSTPAPTPTTPAPAPNTPAPVPTTPVPAPVTPSKPDNPNLIMASTTSTRDAGLMDVMIPLFQAKTGYIVKPVYVGSGAALTMGLQGNADVLLVHSPDAELSFVQSGYGIHRRLIMHNDYIIVGPSSDPAGIKGTKAAADALRKLSTAKVNFYSRGDNSGTDALEKSLWNGIGIVVKDGSASNPSWYVEGGAGTGMLTLLQIASEKKGYTITDRSTYLFNKDKLALDVLVEGDPTLLNIYHVIEVNPGMFSNIKINAAGAKAFSDFMASPEGQDAISKYGVDKFGSPLFFPDAGKTEASLGSK